MSHSNPIEPIEVEPRYTTTYNLQLTTTVCGLELKDKKSENISRFFLASKKAKFSFPAKNLIESFLAGDGDRTHVHGLEGRCITTVLHPRPNRCLKTISLLLCEQYHLNQYLFLLDNQGLPYQEIF